MLSLRNLKTEFDMKRQIEKIDRLIREIEMDEYLNEETLPKIREVKGLMNTLHEQCNIANVVGQSEQLPNLIEIDFDGHLKCQIETTDIKPKVLKAMNGFGEPVNCNKGKIKINEV